MPVFQITATSLWRSLASELWNSSLQIDERDYIGYSGSLGRKGYDESVLAQYQIVDDPKRSATAQDADADPDEPVCLHETVEPYEDEPTRRACAHCGAEFDLTGAETDALRTE